MQKYLILNLREILYSVQNTENVHLWPYLNSTLLPVNMAKLQNGWLMLCSFLIVNLKKIWSMVYNINKNVNL
jgi:hypothetical protein